MYAYISRWGSSMLPTITDYGRGLPAMVHTHIYQDTTLGSILLGSTQDYDLCIRVFPRNRPLAIPYHAPGPPNLLTTEDWPRTRGQEQTRYNEAMRNQQAVEIGRRSTLHRTENDTSALYAHISVEQGDTSTLGIGSLRLPLSGQEGRTSDLTHRISKLTGQEYWRTSEDARRLGERPNSNKYSLTQPQITGALKCRVYDISQTTNTTTSHNKSKHSTQRGRNSKLTSCGQ